MSEYKGSGRFYEGGRSTYGWVRGKRITSFSDLAVNDFFIQISHTFRTENLGVVIEKRAFTPTVVAGWIDSYGRYYGQDQFAIHEHDLQSELEEYYVAVQEEEDKTLVTIRMGYSAESLPPGIVHDCYVHTLFCDTEKEARHIVTILEEETTKLEPSLQKLVRIYLGKPDKRINDVLTVFREIVSYAVRREDVAVLDDDPYWGQFTPEERQRYLKPWKA